MTGINQANDLERRILANLNEAGEDYVSALLNSVLQCTGRESEPLGLVVALTSLLEQGLVELANSRDKATLQWIPLSHAECLQKLKLVVRLMSWVPVDACWKWDSSEPRLTVLLTASGMELGKAILEKFGWSMTEPR